MFLNPWGDIIPQNDFTTNGEAANYGNDMQLLLGLGFNGSTEYNNEINNYLGTNSNLSAYWYSFELSCEFRIIQNLFIYPKIGLSTSSITKGNETSGSTNEIATDPNTIYRLGAGCKYYIMLGSVSSISLNFGMGYFKRSTGNSLFQFDSRWVIMDLAAGYQYRFDVNGISGGIEFGYRSIPVKSIYDNSNRNYGGLTATFLASIPIGNY